MGMARECFPETMGFMSASKALENSVSLRKRASVSPWATIQSMGDKAK